MKSPRVVLLTTLMANAGLLGGQPTGGGSGCCSALTPLIQFGTVTANEGSDLQERRWLQAVVLWRASKPIPRDYGGGSPAAIGLASRRAQRESEDAGRTFVGGFFASGYYGLEFSRDRSRLWVLGREFAVPARDSAIVVMVDRVDGVDGPPIIVGHEYISAQLPDSYWPKHWTSGDTSFFIAPHRPDTLLRAALRVNPRVRAFLEPNNVAAAQGRQFPVTVIQNQCIDFENVKRGHEPGEFRDCRVSDFGQFGATGGKTYYYALYCIIPSYAEPGSCGDSSFSALYHQSRGLAVFTRIPSSKRAELLFERVSIEIASAYAEKPEIIRNGFGTLLYLPIVVDGTGHMNESEYYVLEHGRWERIEAETWLSDVMKRVPAGFESWKGVWPDLHTMRADAFLYRSGDANCCPTGGVAHVRLSIQAKKFVVDSVVIEVGNSLLK